MTRHLVDDPEIPVFHRDALAFPAHDPAPRAKDQALYVPLSEMLQEEWTHDIHFAGYSLPSIPRRLATDAALGYQPKMVLFAVDVDGPNHQRSLTWDQTERQKIASLPGHPLVYATRGGYRLLWCLKDPIVLTTPQDAQRWALSYLAWLDLLEDRHGIVGDRHQAPWTALFRAPDVVRETGRFPAEFWTDPGQGVGLWSEPLVDPPATIQEDHTPTDLDYLAPPDDKIEEAVIALARAWPRTGRRLASLALAGGLARGGWPTEEVADFLETVSELAEPGNGDPAKRWRAARSTVAKVEAGIPVQGWPSLTQAVPAQVVDHVVDLLGLRPKAVERQAWFTQMIREATRSRARTEAKVVATGAPAEAMSLDEARAWFLNVRKTLLKTRDNLDASVDADYLGRLAERQRVTLVRNGDDPNADPVEALARALVRRSPPGTPAPLAQILCQYAGTPERAETILTKVRESTEPEALPGSRPSATDDEGFAVYTKGLSEGLRKSSQENYDLALKKLDVSLAYDRFADRKSVVRGGRLESFEDSHFEHLLLDIESKFSFRGEDGYVRKILNTRARANSFHPILDYFATLKWPGTEAEALDLTSSWLIRLCGAQDTAFIRGASRIVMSAIVRRVRRPGCKFDPMLVLESEAQGTGKSTFVAALCPDHEWFGNRLPLHADAREWAEAINGKMIVEAGELAGMNRADHNTLKDRLSWTFVRTRPAYGHEPKEYQFQFVSIGTTNDDHYLRDQSGNRRYLPVKISRCDVAGLIEERDRLFAAALFLDDLHPEDGWLLLDESLWPAAAVQQEERRERDPFEEPLDDVLTGLSGKVRSCEILTVLGKPNGESRTGDLSRVGVVMRRLGWHHDKQRYVDGRSLNCYSRGEGPWLRAQGGRLLPILITTSQATVPRTN